MAAAEPRVPASNATEEEAVSAEVGKLIVAINTRRAPAAAGAFQSMFSRTKAKIHALNEIGAFGRQGDAASVAWRRKVLVSAIRRLNAYLKREKVELQDLFLRIDEDKSGTIDRDQFRTALAHSWTNPKFN